MDNFSELEFKFKSDNIKLTNFITLMHEIGFKSRKDASSFDHYYTKNNNEEFIRFRESSSPEITKKIKTKESNNFNRFEVDVPLDPTRINKTIVDKYAELEGYKHNFTIYKSCFIFFQENMNAVFYITYNEEMKELGRFIEIEYNKDRVSLVGIDKALEQLKEFEKKLESLGITSQNRLKLSLFEMFRKTI